MTIRVACVAMVLLSVCVWLGCGQSNPLNRQGLTGTVKFNGEPVAKGSITFTPTGKADTMAGGTITNGSYAVATESGVAPGEYAVTINIPDPKWDPKKSRNPKDLAPPDYTNGTGHKVTVKAGASNVFDFDVQTK